MPWNQFYTLAANSNATSSQVTVKNFPRVRSLAFLLLAVSLWMAASQAVAQTTISTGSIVGIVTDPSGAAVAGAKVSVKNEAVGQVIQLTTNASGAYNSGALIVGQYSVQVSAAGFQNVVTMVRVLVGNTATENGELQVGQADQIVEVKGTEVRVNVEQSAVQGVLNATQIENLPVNGRNFLDSDATRAGSADSGRTKFRPYEGGLLVDLVWGTFRTHSTH